MLLPLTTTAPPTLCPADVVIMVRPQLSEGRNYCYTTLQRRHPGTEVSVLQVTQPRSERLEMRVSLKMWKFTNSRNTLVTLYFSQLFIREGERETLQDEHWVGTDMRRRPRGVGSWPSISSSDLQLCWTTVSLSRTGHWGAERHRARLSRGLHLTSLTQSPGSGELHSTFSQIFI